MGLEERIKYARDKSGLSQPALAVKIGISPRSVAWYEKDSSKIQLSLIYKIAEICDVDIIWLLTGQGDMVKNKPSPESPPVFEFAQAVGKHIDIIKQFKNHEKARRINEKLVRLERISESQLDRVERKIDELLEIATDIERDIKKTPEKRKADMPFQHEERRKKKAS